MDAITIVEGVAVPLPHTNIDTDQIIPSVYLKRISKTGFDDALFAEWRRDPGFVLNDPHYSGARVLVAGADFGTGSSREHAVWALRDYGFEAVISSRFADIFRGNAGKRGLLTARVDEAVAEHLLETLAANPGVGITLDLEARTVALGESTFDFQIDDYTRWRLLNGLDDIDLTLQHAGEIDEFEVRRPRWMPTVSASRR